MEMQSSYKFDGYDSVSLLQHLYTCPVKIPSYLLRIGKQVLENFQKHFVSATNQWGLMGIWAPDPTTFSSVIVRSKWPICDISVAGGIKEERGI